MWLIGTGENISFWFDNWHGTPIAETMNLPRSAFK
jgi:hypothetical protein